MNKHSKSTLRAQIATLLKNQKEEVRLKKSEAIRKKLFSLKEFKRAKTILFYASFVRSLRSGLRRGAYGILEPKKESCKPLDLSALDLVLVPGIAFDKKNHRLGRGLGYYDRFLQNLPSHIPTIGLAFDFQVVPRLPHLQVHDAQLSHVIVN